MPLHAGIFAAKIKKITTFAIVPITDRITIWQSTVCCE